MRTRFLAADYSTTTTAATDGGDFVRLPLPVHLPPPPNYPSFSANLLHSFHEIPVVGEIDKLPIDDALSIFLSDVLPHFFDATDFEERSCKEDVEGFHSESQRRKEICCGEKELEKDGSASDNKAGNGLTLVQFEIPEMDISFLPPKNAVYSKMACMDFSEVSYTECTMDPLNSEIRLHDHLEIQQSVYSVDDMNVEYSMEQNADLLEDNASVQGGLKSNNIRFHMFEVNAESVGLGKECMANELLAFENIPKQKLAQEDVVTSKNNELLGAMEFDLVTYLLHSCVETQYLEETKVSSQMEHISILELSHCQEHSTSRHVKPDDDSILTMGLILFDEFVFLDFGLYHFSEVLSDAAKEFKVETCESIFGEAMNFRSFDEMIVCHELILMDDSFKSLPAPIFSDLGITSSLHILVEELVAQLDWQSPSASDGLYLDWHFLGEYDCESVKYSSCLKMLWEIHTHNIDAAMISNDNGKLIFDFIISEDHSNKPNAENYTEILNSSSSDVSVVHTSSGKAGSSNLRNHGEGKRISEDVSLKTVVEKVPLFGESMSSDLEFFLNPRSYNTSREIIPVDKALSHGINTPKKTDLGSTSAQKESKSKLEELLDTIPLNETYGSGPEQAVNKDEDCTIMPVQSLPVGLESEKNLSCKPFCPETVIIVNTRNFNEEMVISRRSTYKRILEMEQEGTQVVERDICLPVDIVVSSAVSLTWYDCRNIGKKSSAQDEAFSCLPLCVESIAANILTSLSFAFSCCILIFEGECNFLGSIMESSDELYAAAASLGIDIQLFCSYSSEMTEEIILSSINVAAKLTKGLYPKMSDSETLAESFLIAFPSINPLSAHAILSSDNILGKFLELSNDGRICTIKKYQVPDESISLLNATSKYGEREDSRSGMTDCSSSVSAPDSGNVQFESPPERKKPKYRHSIYADEPPNDLFHTVSLNPLPDDKLNWAEISDEQFGLSFDDKLFSHSHEFADDMMRPIDKLSLYDFPVGKGLEISDEKNKPCMPRSNIDSNPRWRSATTAKNNFSRPSIKVPNIPQESFVGEVIDVHDTPAFMESGSFSPFLLDVEKDYAARNSRISKRPLDATNLPMFTIPDDIHSAPDVWISRKDNKQNLKEEVKPHFGTTRRNNISVNLQKGLVEEDIIQKAPESAYTQSYQENNTRSFGSTPLSNALHSTQLRQGSPWTIEFLNRIRQKSRLYKQSSSYDLSSPSFGSSGNTSKVTKRKSPSILEFYKYEGGSTPLKIADKKRQKRSSQPLNSQKNKNASAPCPSSWTPVDKRARRTLSFSSNGNGGQSKLVWGDNNSRKSQRRL